MSDQLRPPRPSPVELWEQACAEHPDPPGTLSRARSDRFRELMRENGHLVPGRPKPLPCGWNGGTTP